MHSFESDCAQDGHMSHLGGGGGGGKCIHGLDKQRMLVTKRFAVLCRCGNAETQIFGLIDHFNVDSGSFNATVLARYYLMAEGGSLNAITYAATGVDFVAMESTINQTIADTVTVSVLCLYVLHPVLAVPVSADVKAVLSDQCGARCVGCLCKACMLCHVCPVVQRTDLQHWLI